MKVKSLMILCILILFVSTSCESPGAAAYSVTMQTGGNGSAAAIPNITASGTPITIVATPDSGYMFKEWQVVSGGITLSDATATSATFTMPARDVIIKAFFELQSANMPILALTPSPVTFSNVTYGYASQPSEQNITITNSGSMIANVSGITLDGTNPVSFTLNGEGSIKDSTIAASSSSAPFTVQPNSGLTAGTHSAIITVTYDGGLTATTNVTIIVDKAAGTAVSGPPSEATKTYNSITVNTVTISGNPGAQVVEYAISDAYSSAPSEGWQTTSASTIIFDTLDSNKTYYIYARSAANDNYGAGTHVNSAITTLPLIESANIIDGTFFMGSENTLQSAALPQHNVKLTKGFYMGKYQVTQPQWRAVMAGNKNGINHEPSFFTTAPTGENLANLPVESISWNDALVFCNRLSILERFTPVYSISGSTDPDTWGAVPTSNTWNNVTVDWNASGYRLPTEAEWEYACRAGTTTAYNTGSNAISDNTGWYDSNSNNMTHEVGKKAANNWGLYDMHGNVLEWCWDYWSDAYDPIGDPEEDPKGAVPSSHRVVRGGAYNYYATTIRSAYRSRSFPYDRSSNIGLRVVRTQQ